MANRLILSNSVGEALIHVVHPVAEQALRHIIGKLGYNELFGDNMHIVSDFHTQSKISTPDHVGEVRRNRVRAKLNPNVNPASIKWEGSGTTIDLGNGNTLIQNPNSARSQRNPHGAGNYVSNVVASIFRDDRYAIDLTDRMVGSSLSLEVTMEFMDEHTATEAISRIFQCFSNGDMIGYVDLLYDVPIPKDTQSMLKYLYHLECITPTNPNGALDEQGRFKVAGWYKWLQKYSGKVITTIQNRNRPEHLELVINKSHFQALYLLEFSQDAPQPLDPEGCSVTFNLTVQYARSNRIVLEYPIIVNNNYVEQKFVPMERKVRAAGPESMIMWQNPAVTKEWHYYYTKNKKARPVMFPFWDPWGVPGDSRIIQQGYQPVLIAAFTLDDVTNPQGVTKFDFDTDLAEALGCKLDPNITYTMRKFKNEVLGANRFVNISVFADDIALEVGDCLDFSDGHTLTIKNRMTSPIYRMVVGVNVDKLVLKTIYKRSHEVEVSIKKKYYWLNRGVMQKLNIHTWRLLDDLRATHGDIYTLYDSNETIYEKTTDTVAQQYTVYHKRTETQEYVTTKDTVAKPNTKYYAQTTSGTYIELVVTAGQSLEAYRTQYGTLYTKETVYTYTPIDVEDGEPLAQYGELYIIQENRPEPEYLSFIDNSGYKWNRVWISSVTAHNPAMYPLHVTERTEHGLRS